MTTKTSLLKTAVKARIPLIAAKSDDPRFFSRVVEEIIGEDVIVIDWKKSSITKTYPPISSYFNAGQVGITEYREEVDWTVWGKTLEQLQCSLIVLNPPELHHWMMDVGFVSVPQKMVKEFVEEYCPSQAEWPQLMSALSGLSITNMNRIVKMATAEHGEFTAKSVRAVRRQFFQVTRGLEEIDPNQRFHLPQGQLVNWVGLEGKLFKPDTHPLLTPRGFLFTGTPGTGKTSSAKWLAQWLQIPLYRLDMGMILSKWVGEADQRLQTALQQAESFEPCILLLDEVEKLFEVQDGSGTISRLLGYLLWWLQEHQSKVLVIMTTNDQSKIPPELYRAGRVDQVVVFGGLLQTQVLSFMRELAERLKSIAVIPDFLLNKAYEESNPTIHGRYSQAEVTEKVLEIVKKLVITNKPK